MSEQGDNSSDEGSSLGRGLVDLEVTREEVVQEVLNAPKRRVSKRAILVPSITSILFDKFLCETLVTLQTVELCFSVSVL